MIQPNPHDTASSYQSMAHRPRRLLTAFGAAALCVAWTLPAVASNTVGVALNYGEAVDDDATGVGLDVHFGPRLDLAIVALTTELSGGYYRFGGPADLDVYRVLAGGRLAVGAIIRPSAFAHAGVGHLRYDALAGSRDSATDFATDVGLGLDFTLMPLVDLGVVGSYNWVRANTRDNAVDWLQFGAHVTFVTGG